MRTWMLRLFQVWNSWTLRTKQAVIVIAGLVFAGLPTVYFAVRQVETSKSDRSHYVEGWTTSIRLDLALLGSPNLPETQEDIKTILRQEYKNATLLRAELGGPNLKALQHPLIELHIIGKSRENLTEDLSGAATPQPPDSQASLAREDQQPSGTNIACGQPPDELGPNEMASQQKTARQESSGPLSDIEKILQGPQEPTVVFVNDSRTFVFTQLFEKEKPVLKENDVVKCVKDLESMHARDLFVQELAIYTARELFNSAPADAPADLAVKADYYLVAVFKRDLVPTVPNVWSLVGFTLLFSAIVAHVLGLLLQRFVVTPIHSLSDTMERVTNRGDYDVPMDIEQAAAAGQGDEIGRLQSAFVTMLGAIRSQLRQNQVLTNELVLEKQLLEQRVAERTEELTKINKQLDDFAVTVSHDLQAPLRNVSIIVEGLRRRCKDGTPVGMEDLVEIEHQCQREMEMVRRMLEIARIPRTAWKPVPVDLNEICDHVEQGLAADLAAAGVTMRREVRLPVVTGDPTLLYQLFQNLLTNAAKYNDKAVKWIKVGVASAGEPRWCELFVADNGIGIRDKDHPKVFGLFEQLHSYRKFAPGIGAGLTLVKAIVERHGGTIRFDSIYGTGTTFYFTLPAYAENGHDQSAAEAVAATASDSDRRG